MLVSRRFLLLPVLSSLTASVGAVDWNWDQNTTTSQTHVRERAEAIPSIYGDVRRPLVGVSPAYPMPTWTNNISIGYEWSRVAWAADSAMARKISSPVASTEKVPYLQSRSDLELRWSGMTSWQWLGYEFVLPMSYAGPAYAESLPSLGEIAYRGILPLVTSRYGAVTAVLGASTMIPGMDTDPLISHGWITPQAGIRATAGVGMVVMTADTLVSWCPIGEWDSQDDGIASGDELEHDYRSLIGSIAVTWRPLRWLRAGVVQRYEQHQWQPRSGSDTALIEMGLVTAPTMFVVEATPIKNMNVSIEMGADLLSNHDIVAGDFGSRLESLPILGLFISSTF